MKKLKLAANIIARIKGFKDKPKPLATEIAIGNMIIAVALLEIVPLNNIVTRKIRPSTNTSPFPTIIAIRFSEIHISAPLLLIATPSGIIPARRNIICQSIFL